MEVRTRPPCYVSVNSRAPGHAAGGHALAVAAEVLVLVGFCLHLITLAAIGALEEFEQTGSHKCHLGIHANSTQPNVTHHDVTPRNATPSGHLFGGFGTYVLQLGPALLLSIGTAVTVLSCLYSVTAACSNHKATAALSYLNFILTTVAGLLMVLNTLTYSGKPLQSGIDAVTAPLAMGGECLLTLGAAFLWLAAARNTAQAARPEPEKVPLTCAQHPGAL